MWDGDQVTLAEVGLARARQCLRTASAGNKGGREHSSHSPACFFGWPDPQGLHNVPNHNHTCPWAHTGLSRSGRRECPQGESWPRVEEMGHIAEALVPPEADAAELGTLCTALTTPGAAVM